ncbi:hypothetical protein [Streptomyces chilikensis]|uniref:hypothetical protein n=1 Tax=Streptomyces chilikensis TaxID=1194079 RepID=UPI001408AA6F|nr:hypothetical protein [Streptomyces chilikensis]
MTHPTPPQQPAEGNPYATAPGVPPQGAPQNAPQGYPGAPAPAYPGAPAPAYGAPAMPVLPSGGKLALGAVAGLVAALVAAVVYGMILGKAEVEIGYAAVGVGALVGLVAGKTGGGNPVTGSIAAIISLGAVYLGQLIGISVLFADSPLVAPDVTFLQVLTENFSLVQETWSESMDLMSLLFIALGGVAAFGVSKKVGSD